jgi:hypothetical protein
MKTRSAVSKLKLESNIPRVCTNLQKSAWVTAGNVELADSSINRFFKY